MSAENSGSFGRFCVYVSYVDKKPTVKKKKKKRLKDFLLFASNVVN